MMYLTSDCFYYHFFLFASSFQGNSDITYFIKTTSILRYAGILCDLRLPIMPQHTTIYWMHSNSKYIKVRGKKACLLEQMQ